MTSVLLRHECGPTPAGPIVRLLPCFRQSDVDSWVSLTRLRRSNGRGRRDAKGVARWGDRWRRAWGGVVEAEPERQPPYDLTSTGVLASGEGGGGVSRRCRRIILRHTSYSFVTVIKTCISFQLEIKRLIPSTSGQITPQNASRQVQDLSSW